MRGGFVVGFVSVGICIGTLLTLILVFKRFFQPFVSFSLEHNYALMFELIAGFGLGGSSMALFGRVGGGIYTKAADVGADLVGKIEAGLDEDSPRNPATIADNVGDNVGDIAGMGSDLFGSLSESTCAALVIFANSLDITSRDLSSLYYSLLISAVGIVSSFFSSLVGLYGYRLAEFS